MRFEKKKMAVNHSTRSDLSAADLVSEFFSVPFSQTHALSDIPKSNSAALQISDFATEPSFSSSTTNIANILNMTNNNLRSTNSNLINLSTLRSNSKGVGSYMNAPTMPLRGLRVDDFADAARSPALIQQVYISLI